MKFDFDKKVDRKGTDCIKWDKMAAVYGSAVNEDTQALWIADMDFEVAPAIQGALAKRMEHGVFAYSCPSDRFYEVAAAWIGRHYNWQVQQEWLHFCPGIVPALNLAVLCYSEPGDKVISLTPVYGPFFRAATAHGREFVSCSLDFDENLHASIDFTKLEALLDDKCKILLLCSPHNPAGRVWNDAELQQLADIAARHNLIIVSDEIHADFVYTGHAHRSIATVNEYSANHSVTCYAPSKTFNIAGLPGSMIVIPNPELKEKFVKLKSSLHYSANLFSYIAMEAAWEHGDEWLAELMKYLEGNRDFLVAYIQQHIPLIRTNKPEASYLLWLDCRELMRAKNLADDDALTRFLLEEAGLALNRGTSYGEEGQGFARLNFAVARSEVEKAIHKLALACKD